MGLFLLFWSPEFSPINAGQEIAINAGQEIWVSGQEVWVFISLEDSWKKFDWPFHWKKEENCKFTAIKHVWLAISLEERKLKIHE